MFNVMISYGYQLAVHISRQPNQNSSSSIKHADRNAQNGSMHCATIVTAVVDTVKTLASLHNVMAEKAG